LPARADSLEDARAAAPDSSLAARRWNLLEEAKAAALIPPRHPNYPAVEDAIWQGIREAILGYRDAEEALRQTEAAASRAAEGIR
jgi:ABC-type glycerol-3-phosphate transport system substrate-binding protein